MSWEHSTRGHKGYEGFVEELRANPDFIVEDLFNPNQPAKHLCRGQDLDGVEQPLRMARFQFHGYRPMIVEEYLAVDDKECDGASIVSYFIYSEGARCEPPKTIIFDP